MIFKTFFFLLIIVFSSLSHAQWWVDGGNLIWPYGNVSITKGNLSVTGDLLADQDLNVTGNINSTDSSQLKISSGSAFIALNNSTDNAQITANTISIHDGNLTGLNINGTTPSVSVYSVGTASLGDPAGDGNHTYLQVDDPNQRITLDALRILLSSIPSDSTQVSTSELWFDSSTGTIHRKF